MEQTNTFQMDLRELRLSKGLTQAELGSQALVSQYENGRLQPGPGMVKHLAQELGVSTEVLFAACLESKRRAESARPSAPAPAIEQSTEQQEGVSSHAAQPTTTPDAAGHA